MFLNDKFFLLNGISRKCGGGGGGLNSDDFTRGGTEKSLLSHDGFWMKVL